MRCFTPALLPILLTLALRADAQSAQPDGISPTIAVGPALQDRDYRASLGFSARVGVTGAMVRRLRWSGEITMDYFEPAARRLVLCLPGASCGSPPTYPVTLAAGTVEVRWGESTRPSAYLLTGAGGTLAFFGSEVPDHAYAHLTGGIGWIFRGAGARPYIEVRLINYLGVRDPMSARTLTGVAGVRL